jgi:hypothetical protein
MSFITAYCRISETDCFLNGSLALSKDAQSGDSWFKQLYKELAVEYPKFYKMDLLAQAGFIGSELIKRVSGDLIHAYQDDEIALLFANSEASADTDVRFKETYLQSKTPSPSLFVYTLPNIVLGEIAIRNKWYGENMFAVLPKFTPDFYVQYGRILLSSGSKAVLGGWLGILDGRIEVFIFLVEQGNRTGLPFTNENVIKCADL